MKKIRNILFVTLTFALMFMNVVTVKAANVVTSNGDLLVGQEFTFSYDFKLYLNPTLSNNNTVYANVSIWDTTTNAFVPYEENVKTTLMARWENLNEVHYTPSGTTTELTGEELYNYIVRLQTAIDESGYHARESDAPAEVGKLNEVLNAIGTVTKSDSTFKSALYCNRDEFYDRIELPTACTDQYYIVIAAVSIEDDNPSNPPHQYHTARAYKVNADSTKCPTCAVEGGKYYDDEGKEVTEEEYNQACHTCTVENGKYYDKDGKEVTEAEYNKSCKSCKIESGKYYNKVGKEVTKKEYEKDCGNPDTGINNPYLFIAIIIAAGAAIALVSKNKKYV